MDDTILTHKYSATPTLVSQKEDVSFDFYFMQGKEK
jgi:hypothetical protein